MGGCVLLVPVGVVVPLPPPAWAAGIGYTVVSTLLLTVALRRRRAERFGAANAVTATRSMLVGVVTAMVVASFWGEASAALFVSIVAVALALDGVDGYVARRTGSESELGARFDMEVDAFLLLVLSVYVAPFVGWWVLIIGLLRYGFVAAGWALPFMRATLPPRYWRKVVTAASGIALAAVASQLLPLGANVLVVVTALALMLESFGRDVVWLVRMNPARREIVSLERAATASPPEESG